VIVASAIARHFDTWQGVPFGVPNFAKIATLEQTPSLGRAKRCRDGDWAREFDAPRGVGLAAAATAAVARCAVADYHKPRD